MAGRKSQSAESSSDVVNSNSNELIAQLMKQIEELKSQMQNQAKNMSDEDDDFNKEKINQDDYIKVISLTNYQLNLNTNRNANGKIYSFYKFGEVKRIVYSDVVKIIDENRNFLESGYFYLMDQRCIRKHGLLDIYKDLLTKESIEKIIEGKSNDVVSLFKSANQSQQSLVVDLLVEKLARDPDSVDLNLIDKISRASGIKIQEEAEKARDFNKFLSGEEQGTQ